MKFFFNITYGIVLLVLPLLIVAGVLLAVCKRDLTIYPGVSTTMVTSDKAHRNGKTEVHFINHHKDSISVSFTMRMNGTQFPFLLIEFLPPKGRYFDVSGYDYVEIELRASAENAASLPVRANLLTEIPGYSQRNNLETHRVMSRDFIFREHTTRYKLPINEFNAAAWWLELNAKIPDVGKPDYRKVTAFQIGSPAQVNLGVRQQHTVYKITFGKNNYAVIAAGLLLVAVFYGIVYIKVRREKPLSPPTLPHKKLEIGNIEDEEISKLAAYMHANFHDPDITNENLKQTLGMSESKLAGLFKSGFDTTFKKYLNHLRLQEARRLLSDTNLPVNEIAWKVGYTSVTHFNRVFKEAEGYSPNQYRKLSEKNHENLSQ